MGIRQCRPTYDRHSIEHPTILGFSCMCSSRSFSQTQSTITTFFLHVFRTLLIFVNVSCFVGIKYRFHIMYRFCTAVLIVALHAKQQIHKRMKATFKFLGRVFTSLAVGVYMSFSNPQWPNCYLVVLSNEKVWV